MHLPDGFLSLPVAAGMGAVSTGVVGLALRRCRQMLDDRAEALLGVTAAGIFAAQMVNFPVPGGTSGHLVGGALAGIILGPSAGLVAITCVLIVQCFLFADGGLLALGANIFNMGIIGCFSGSAIHALLRPLAASATGKAVVAGIAAWCATLLAAAACSIELSLSGNFGLARTLSVMVGIHAVIGVGEAMITGLVVRALLERSRSKFGTIEPSPQCAPLPRTVLIGGLGLAATIVAVLAPFSSSLPDGLDRSLSILGASEPSNSPWSWQIADYQFSDLGKWGGTISAGLLGLTVVTLLALATSKLAASKRAADAQNS